VKHVAGVTLALAFAFAPSQIHAQDAWPSRSITLVVPYGAGGYTDLIGRMTANYLEKALGKSVVVENRPGGGGIVGTGAVVRSAPDGYTFCVCSVGAISVVPFAQGQKVGYDPLNDLIPVSILSTISQAVVVKKSLPIKSLADLVSYAKANPGKLNYGSSGLAGLTHYSVELFQSRTGTKMNHIPYKTGAQGVLAIVSGEVDFAFANMTDALPQIEADTMRGIAVTSRERSPYFPNLPTVHETTSPGFVVETWNGLMAPAKTPEAIIKRMSEVLMRMADDEEVKKAMVKAGANTLKTTPEQYAKQILAEIDQWKPLLAEITSTKKQ
jgi:tripartite-type tricarboxylate transporter receptor subunit TctC